MLLDARIPLQKVLLVIAYAAIHGAGQSHLVEPPEKCDQSDDDERKMRIAQRYHGNHTASHPT